MNTLSFTALDFETATPNHNSICQIGFVIVNNGVIERKFSYLVKPPENEFAFHNIKVHKIESFMTENAPTFNQLWNEISKYFINQHIVCHNASFDLLKLESTLNYYDIPIPKFSHTCTCELFGGRSLDKCCEEENINFTNHHDALADAEACAKLYLKSLENREGLKVQRSTNIPYSQKKIKKEDLRPNFNIENKNNPFYQKKVVFTGDLMNFKRNEAAHRIKLLGADVNTSISKKTDLVIIGRSPGPSKMKKIQSLGIQTISEEDFINLLESK